MCVQKYFCLEETAYYHARSTEEKVLTLDVRKEFTSLYFTKIFIRQKICSKKL
jgi:hypothetical protein